MQVYELIALLRKMPQQADVKTDDRKYLWDPTRVEYEEAREYVIIRTD